MKEHRLKFEKKTCHILASWFHRLSGSFLLTPIYWFRFFAEEEMFEEMLEERSFNLPPIFFFRIEKRKEKERRNIPKQN